MAAANTALKLNTLQQVIEKLHPQHMTAVTVPSLLMHRTRSSIAKENFSR